MIGCNLVVVIVVVVVVVVVCDNDNDDDDDGDDTCRLNRGFELSPDLLFINNSINDIVIICNLITITKVTVLVDNDTSISAFF